MPGGKGIALLAVVLLFTPALGQHQPPSEKLLIDATTASTWMANGASVVHLRGPVVIELDDARLSAADAVIWLEELPDRQPGEQLATIALLGDAVLEQEGARRSGDDLLVTARVAGTIRITAQNRLAQNPGDTPTYRRALDLREAARIARTPPVLAALAPAPSRAPAPPSPAPVLFRAGDIQSTTDRDGKLAIVLTGDVVVTRRDPDGSFLEMQAQRGVLFTTLERARDLAELQQRSATEDVITAAYLEGDVRVTLTPADPARAEQRLESERVYYELATDRAVLTDAVLQTFDPQRQIPIIVRADTIRQLSEGEYRATRAQVTTSAFAVPSYAISARRVYVRQQDTGDPRLGTQTYFSARNVTLDVFSVPVFWLPSVGGTVTERGVPLRSLQLGETRAYGFAVRTEWGLMETLGYPPPDDLDIGFRADYYTERGPGVGIDAAYSGGFVSETTAKAWNFQGDFTSYVVPNDQGVDHLGRRRRRVEPEQEFRGWVRWQHQHLFPDDWQVQLRSAWVSDPTFLEQWFRHQFYDGLPLETSAYVKRQRDTEALTLLVTIQPNNFVTTADMLQEVFPDPVFPGSTLDRPFEIERLPELGYHRIGDSVGDTLTFYSQNTFSGLRMNPGRATLEDHGFRAPAVGRPAVMPGMPAVGTTGVTDDTVYRGDFRQELAWPFSIDQFRVVPYVMGRYTAYDDSPADGSIDRLFAGTGVRVTTTFWKVYDGARSELLDINRVRHVIEPQLHAFTSAQSTGREKLFIYDEQIDAIHDISALQLALKQRWQTKRGAPGRQRSVDFLTLDVSANFFANKPPDDELVPLGFRGLFYDALPEASIPRNSINSELLWRITDTTVLLTDMQYNTDEYRVATASIGLAARRGDYLSWFVGTRYIEDLDSAVTTVAVEYELTPKYTLGIRNSFDFGAEQNVYHALTVQRRFDRFFMLLTVYYDPTEQNSGVSFAIFPEGLARVVSSQGLQTVFGR